MRKKENGPVELRVGFKVWIGDPPREGKRKTLYLVTEVDELGNCKMHSVSNPKYRRNFHNVNVLAGELTREDGRPIKGKPIVREPLPKLDVYASRRSRTPQKRGIPR